MSWLWRRAPVEDPLANYKYAITIDSGSSGSRLEIYSWLDHEIAIKEANSTERTSLPVIQINGHQKKY
jgi:Golgi nucleoside diphosphatase